MVHWILVIEMNLVLKSAVGDNWGWRHFLSGASPLLHGTFSYFSVAPKNLSILQIHLTVCLLSFF